jgi:hypothetical protein
MISDTFSGWSGGNRGEDEEIFSGDASRVSMKNMF